MITLATLDFIAALVLFIIITALAALLFVVWMVWTILRLSGHAVMSMGRLVSGGHAAAHAHDEQLCRFAKCRAVNPSAARFCRRCGRELSHSSVQHVQVRRAAVV